RGGRRRTASKRAGYTNASGKLDFPKHQRRVLPAEAVDRAHRNLHGHLTILRADVELLSVDSLSDIFGWRNFARRDTQCRSSGIHADAGAEIADLRFQRRQRDALQVRAKRLAKSVQLRAIRALQANAVGDEDIHVLGRYPAVL